MLINFGEWKPDSITVGADTLNKAFNVISQGITYDAMAAFVPAVDQLPTGKCRGAASFITKDGFVVTIAGTDSALYVRNGNGWNDISIVGGYTGSGELWRFLVWGNYVLATNYADKIQAWEIGSTDGFKVMSETAPRCKDFTIVNEFVICLNTVDDLNGEQPSGLWNSPIGDPFGVWEISQTTLCDFVVIPVGSFGVGIVGGSYGTIFMRTAVVRLTFVGSPFAFRNEIMDYTRGCVGPDAFIADNQLIFFLADDGFFGVEGNAINPIGFGKIDRYYQDNAEVSAASLITMAFDKNRKLFYIAYPRKGNFEKPESGLIYDIIGKRWTETEAPFTVFVKLLSIGYTLEELDTISTNVDLLPYPLDSFFYKGGIPFVAGFDENGFMLAQGDCQANGYIITGDIALNGNMSRAITQRVRLIAEQNGDHKMQISGRQSINSPIQFRRVCGLSRIGDFTEKVSGRYFNFKFLLNPPYSNLSSFEVNFVKEGEL